MWHGNWGWVGWVVMTLSMVAFWALVIWAITALTRGGGSVESPGDAKRILDERFARGDIDDDEYRRRLATLQSPRGNVPGVGSRS